MNRYLTLEEERFLEEKKSAYERVLEQASRHMKKEAFLWIENRKLLERAQMAEGKLKTLQVEQEYNITDLDLVRENRRKMKLITSTGGKGPPTGPSDSWLLDLEIGTIFLISDKQVPLDFNLGLFRLLERTPGGASVLLSKGNPSPIYVNTRRFCRKYEMFENLGAIVYDGDEDLKGTSLEEYISKKGAEEDNGEGNRV